MLPIELSERIISAVTLLALINYIQCKFALGLHLVLSGTYVLLLSALSNDPTFLLTGGLLLIVAEIDRREHRIPDIFTKSAICALIIFCRSDIKLIVIAVGWILGMYLFTYFLPEVLGRGDVKLIAALTLLNGYFQNGTHGGFLVTLLGLSSLFALPFALAARVSSGKTHTPFAPSIAAAWLVLAVFGGV